MMMAITDRKRKREKKKSSLILQVINKKMAFKKADGKKEHNNSLTSSSKVQPAEMVDMAAVNPDTEGITSPVGSPAVNLPGTNVYPGNVVIPPPPRPVTLQQLPPQHLQQRANWPQQQQQMAAVYVVPTQQPHFIPAAFQSPGPPPQQIVAGQFVAQPYQQGHFAVPQYHQAGGTPVQGVVYSGQIVAGPHAHVLTRAQSLPSSATPGGEQAHSSGWVGQSSTSPPPLNNAAESSWAANHAANPGKKGHGGKVKIQRTATIPSGQPSLQMIHHIMQTCGPMNLTKSTAQVMKMLIVAVHQSLQVKKEKCFSGLHH
ncbi:uncharacterized protein LOC144658600 isoform X2 [Oculina patagonica]